MLSNSQHIVIGGKGTGKSTFIREKFISQALDKNYFPIIFDPQHEEKYTEVLDQLGEGNYYKGKLILFTFWEFVDYIDHAKPTNSIIVFEECSIYFTKTQVIPESIREIIISSRHDNNTLIFVFHAMVDTSSWIFRQCSHLWLKHTNDAKRAFQAKDLQNLIDAREELKTKHAKDRYAVVYVPLSIDI